MRKVFLDDLPKWNTGRHKGTVNWKETIGYKVHFIYDDIEDDLEIVDYYKDYNKIIYLKIKYNGNFIKINSTHFSKCKIGRLLNKYTGKFKIEIGTIIKDEKRNITIIDKEIRKDKNGREWKYYKYRCNICGNEGYIMESNLLTHKRGCNACCNAPKKELLGYNTIYDKTPWMMELGVSEEDAKKYTPNSNESIYVTCPNCITTKKCIINNIYKTRSIGCNCSDNAKYTEKFIFNMLTQLEINFIWQLAKGTFKWCDKYRYDFYFEYNNEKYIIETNGIQHYKETNRSRSLKEEQENDKLKYELAIKNGINSDNYIVIDFRESTLEWGKEHIINSKLNELFDLSIIDWNKCEEYALKNIVKDVCDYWKEHREINKEDITATYLYKIFKLNRNTIRYYLKKGTKLGWCNYDPDEEKNKNSSKNGKKNGKPILMYDKNMNFIGEYDSVSWLARNSKELFGIKLDFRNISAVATGNNKQYKGFIFKYK